MTHSWSLPELTDKEYEPMDFITRLRQALFNSQTAAAGHYGFDRGTISRYESGIARAPLGYLASLCRMLLTQPNQLALSETERIARQNFMVEQLQKLAFHFPDKYGFHGTFQNWAQLCEAADRFEEDRRKRSKSKRDADQPGPTSPGTQGTAPTNPIQDRTIIQNIFTGAPAAGPQPGSAPSVPSLLVGRDDDLRRLKARFAIGRKVEGEVPLRVLTSLHGWPGVGKTSLAAALAHDPEIKRVFSDGVLWASLGPKPSVFAELTAWARALGISDSMVGRSIAEVSAHLAAELRQQRRLLIIDDVWTVEAGRPFLVGGTGCATLVTTRLPEVANALAPTPDEIYLLDVLSEDDAFELLRTLAPTVVTENETESAVLVRELERLPLAIQVAGRLLHAEARRGFSVTQLLVEIRDGARLLEEKAPSDRVDLESGTTPTVAALLETSTRFLDEYTRDCFAYLGAFAAKPATFDQVAMQSVWAVEDPRPVIRTLIDRGLLEPLNIGRYWIHALLVAHARTLLTA